MQAAAYNGKYDIVRQAGMDLVKIHHDLENEKPPRPIVQKPAPPLNYPQLLLNPFQLVQKSVPQLDSQQFPPNPLSSPFYLAQKCAPTPPQVQNPALKCARPFLSGFKMRAACAPRCANFPKNPIFSPKTQKTTKKSFFTLKPLGPNAEILLCLRGDFWQEKSVGNRSQSACAGGDTGSSPQTAPSKSADRNPL